MCVVFLGSGLAIRHSPGSGASCAANSRDSQGAKRNIARAFRPQPVPLSRNLGRTNVVLQDLTPAPQRPPRLTSLALKVYNERAENDLW